MKYIVAISLVSLLALTSCFEKQVPDPLIEDDTMTSEDVLAPNDEDDTMQDEDDTMPEDDAMNSEEDDNLNGSTQTDVEVEVMSDDEEMEVLEEDLEALFQDILGE